jgi:hypothetical protein
VKKRKPAVVYTFEERIKRKILPGVLVFVKITVNMAKKEVVDLVVEQKILSKIHTVRGDKVILDKDLAVMYGIETKVFNQAVKRHMERFPKDFMFTLTKNEWDNLRSHFVTSS